MEHQRILNLLSEASVTRKWNIVNDLWNANYDVRNEIIYNAEVLKFNLYDYKNAYTLVRHDITVAATFGTQASFKNCAPFTKCITNIDGTTIVDTEDLDLIMPMYNLIEYIWSYSGTTGHLWFYWKDDATDFHPNHNNFKSFKHKAKLLGSTEAKIMLMEF